MQTTSGVKRSGAHTLCETLLRRVLHSLAVGGVLAAASFGGSVSAQQTTSGTPQLEEVVVTGSYIKRTDTETPSPVQVISAQDILNSGYTNVSAVLRNLASNGAGTLNQSFGQAFASGATGIALRGLTVGDTLTLIDDERMVAYPLSDDGERSFVDISAIPINTIASIEVLKDGASAIYGADAIAGVVNVKLRPTYVGSQILAEAGETQKSDGRTYHASAIIGWGDLNSDGYNIYAALDWHTQNLIWGTSRSGLWTNLDWSAYPGGQNTTPGAIGAQGLVYPDSATGYLLNPNTKNGQPYAFLPGCTQQLQNADKCTFGFPGQLQPPSTQTNFLAKITKALVGDWKLTVTGSVFDSVAQQTAPPTEPAFGHVLNNTGAEQGSIPLTAWGPYNAQNVIVYPALSLPANSPLNPFGKQATLVYSFPDVGPWVIDTETQTYRLFGDLRGTALGWDLDASVGLMYARMSENFTGQLLPAAAQQALDNGTYVPGSPQNNISLIAPPTSTQPSSTLDVIDLHGSRPLLQMPGGPLQVATGVQYIHKAQNQQDPLTVAYGIQEGITNFTVGSQDDTAGFVEFGGKVLRTLEASAAVRYDHYDTYGGQATPKFGVKYTPIDMLSIRGTWGKGFRAPSISESANSGVVFGAGNSFDPVLCPNGTPNVAGTFNSLCSYPVAGLQAPNSHLKAVTSYNSTFGVIFEPVQAFNVSVDWYYIKLDNDIISAISAGGLGANFTSETRGPSQTLPVCINTTTPGGPPCTTAPQLTPVGILIANNYPYINASETKTSGFDVDLRSLFDLGRFGRLTGELNWTYIRQYEIVVAGTIYDLAGTHGPSGVSGDTGNPKQRAVASLTWEQGPLTATVSANYTGSFNITDSSAGYNTCLQAISGSGNGYGAALPAGAVAALPAAWANYCTVTHFTSFNLYSSYALTDHFSVHGSITNLFNAQPPVDLQTYGGGALYRYTTLDQDGAVGRFFLLGATLKF
jgi:iron complex outermembrane receptor protein